MPRMTTVQRDAIVDPAQGLQIYNLDDLCTDIFSGNAWSKNCNMVNVGDVTLPAGSWAQKADVGPTGRSGAVGFSIGSKGYIGTGSIVGNNNSIPVSDFWEYDPTSNTWTQKADFGGVPRYFAFGFSIGTKGYVGTGAGGSHIYYSDFWEYDPSSNTWTQKGNFGGAQRQSAVGFSIGTKGYVGTGYNDFYLNDFWEYNPTTDSWSQKENVGGGLRDGAVGFSIGSKGYIGTGFHSINHKNDF